jgi:phosphoglycolate phosphatase
MEPPPLSAENLIFDLDGTLVDSVPGIEIAVEAAFRSIGRSIPAGSLRSVIGPPIGVIARRIEPSLTDDEIAQIEQRFRHDYDTFGWRGTVAFDGVVQTLRELRRRGLQLFIVTNKPRVPTEKILADLALQGFFVEAVSRDSQGAVPLGKTEMLNDLLRRRKLPPETAIMVGDTVEDSDAATVNGLRFVHAGYGYGAPFPATYSIRGFSELLTLVGSPPPHANNDRNPQ